MRRGPYNLTQREPSRRGADGVGACTAQRRAAQCNAGATGGRTAATVLCYHPWGEGGGRGACGATDDGALVPGACHYAEAGALAGNVGGERWRGDGCGRCWEGRGGGHASLGDGLYSIRCAYGMRGRCGCVGSLAAEIAYCPPVEGPALDACVVRPSRTGGCSERSDGKETADRAPRVCLRCVKRACRDSLRILGFYYLRVFLYVWCVHATHALFMRGVHMRCFISRGYRCVPVRYRVLRISSRQPSPRQPTLSTHVTLRSQADARRASRALPRRHALRLTLVDA